MHQSYQGTLRPRFTKLEENEFQVEWVNSEGEVIWTETCVLDDKSFVSQIECEGEFNLRQGHFFKDGKRHFVMHVDPGLLGSLLGA